MTTTLNTSLRTTDVSVGYDGTLICHNIDLLVPTGSYTAIIGPNACGKSTLLRAVARALPLHSGQVLLDGRDIHTQHPRQLATQMGLLPQTSIAPEGIRVADLVSRGRFPHQGMFDRWSAADEQAVVNALEATSMSEHAGEFVGELSGGQRQRVWVAMALAQETPLLLLDEPTTYLDITHQYGLLELFDTLRLELGRTIVVVLHDLNQAARYADNLVVMKAGQIIAAGSPSEILTQDLIEDVYELRCRVIEDPETGAPLVIPKAVLR